jgi:hypothetical protein
MFLGDESHRLSGGRRFEDFDKLLMLSAFERGDGRLSELGSYPQELLTRAPPDLVRLSTFSQICSGKAEVFGPEMAPLSLTGCSSVSKWLLLSKLRPGLSSVVTLDHDVAHN